VTIPLLGLATKRLKASKAGIQWPCPYPNHPGTVKRYVRGLDPMFDHKGFLEKFGKKIPQDAKIYFYMDEKNEGRANIFLRPYKPAAEEPDKEYPFFLTTGRVIEMWHTGTMTMRIPETARAHPHAYVEIHPEDAKNYGITNGDMVEVTSRRGKVVLPAVVTQKSLPGILFIPMHDQYKDRMVNFVCNDAVDPGSFEPEYKIAAVKIKRVSGPVKLVERYIISDVNEKFI